MKSEELTPNLEFLTRISTLLDDLGPFTPNTPREKKWRTTEQLANELEIFGKDAFDHLNLVLCEHEAHCFECLKKKLPHQALIRRAKYPARTTALPLWGSVKHHGPPWIEQHPSRTDPPEDIPSTLFVPNTAPQVFLSHTHQDAGLSLRLAEELAVMEIGSWRFETHIDQRGNIAECVREAMAEAACLVGLVTRQSIASLWMLTELHTSLEAGKTVVLVVDSNDALLLQLLQSVQFPHPEEDYDLSVDYDENIVCLLKQDYGLQQSESRTERYKEQVRDFLATLPKYLGHIPPESTERVWKTALAFPLPPAEWSGFIKLSILRELPTRLEPNQNDPC